jgi:hypothetical protein
MSEQSFSPTPRKPQDHLPSTKSGIGFPAAMQAVKEGKKVHKLEWQDKEYYGFLNGDILSLHKPDGKNYQWIINDGDLQGEDYLIL